MDKYKRLWGENKLFTKTGKRLFDIANANEIEYETKCALEKRNTEKKALLPDTSNTLTKIYYCHFL